MNLTPSLRILRWPALLLPCLCLLLLHTAHAKCEITGVSQTEDERAAKLPFGRINVTPALLTDRTLLASITVPPTNYTFRGAHAGSVLWKCDKEDLNDLHFLVSTNGDSRFGGEFELAADGVYGTWFSHIGLRQTMAGITLNRTWQKVPLTSWLPVKERVRGQMKERIHIRLMDIPPLQAELYWIETPVPSSGWYDCPGYPIMPVNNVHGHPYICRQPASYIQLVAPGIAHDEEGEDHRDFKWDSWWADNGFAYTLWEAVTLSANPTCIVSTTTPHVHFGAVRAQYLRFGMKPEANFSIALDCDSATVSGNNNGETAIGLQVSQPAFHVAQVHGWANGGGVEYLLSDDYDTGTDIARGVGIALFDSDGDQRRFVGWPGTVGKNHPRGEWAGWYSVAKGAQQIDLSQDKYRLQLDFTARLMQLPGETVTPGKVRATASVLVKVQ